MENIVCFDIGGTFIKYAIINEKGQILYRSQMPTPKCDCKVNIPIALTAVIENLSKKYVINGIGISTAGNVDADKGEVIFASDNLPGYTGARLSEVLKKNTGLTCRVENDVNAAALGESWMGSGKGVSSFLCVTLGTGVGGAIIIDNQLVKGIKNGAGEIGHMTIEMGGIPCGCGGKGCFEQYASTRALVRAYASKANVCVETLDGMFVMNQVMKQDAIAIQVYNQFVNHIAIGLVNVVHLLDPGLIVLGGGISENGQTLIDDLNTALQLHLIPAYRPHTVIKPASLGNDAGLVGACRLFYDK